MQKILAILSTVAFLYSCQKEPVEPIKSADNINSLRLKAGNGKKDCDRKEYLIHENQRKGWVIYRYWVNGFDSTRMVPDCALDNVIYLTKKGEYIDTEGKSKCSSSLPNIHNQGTYVYDCNTNQISLVSPYLTTIFKILELKENNLKVEFYDPLKKAEIQFWLKPEKHCI